MTNLAGVLCYTQVIQYDMVREFNMDLKAECGHVNVAHITRNKKI